MALVEGRSAAWRVSSVDHFCPSCVRGRPQRWPANALERGAREKRPLLGAVPGQLPKAAALSPEVLGACSRHADVDTRDNTRPRKGRFFSSPLAEGSIFVATPRAPVSEADAAVRCVERGLQKRLPGMLSHCVHTYIASTHTYTHHTRPCACPVLHRPRAGSALRAAMRAEAPRGSSMMWTRAARALSCAQQECPWKRTKRALRPEKGGGPWHEGGAPSRRPPEGRSPLLASPLRRDVSARSACSARRLAAGSTAPVPIPPAKRKGCSHRSRGTQPSGCSASGSISWVLCFSSAKTQELVSVRLNIHTAVA